MYAKIRGLEGNLKICFLGVGRWGVLQAYLENGGYRSEVVLVLFGGLFL